MKWEKHRLLTVGFLVFCKAGSQKAGECVAAFYNDWICTLDIYGI